MGHLADEVDEQYYVIDCSDLERLLSGCERLSQLAVTIPPVSWEYKPGQMVSVNEDFGQALVSGFSDPS